MVAPSPAVEAETIAKRELAAIEVTGPKAGRRRAGRAFDAATVRIEAGDLTDAELGAILADSMLTVATIFADD